MSSQKKMLKFKLIYWTLFSLQWIFMISFIFSVFNAFETLKWLDIVSSVFLFGWSIQFYVLQLVHSRQIVDQTYGKINKTIEKINEQPREFRRGVIRNFEKDIKK